MSQIVNLNRARKAKARADAGRQAAQNRGLFGLSKTQKSAARAENRAAERTLDDLKRER